MSALARVAQHLTSLALIDRQRQISKRCNLLRSRFCARMVFGLVQRTAFEQVVAGCGKDHLAPAEQRAQFLGAKGLLQL